MLAISIMSASTDQKTKSFLDFSLRLCVFAWALFLSLKRLIQRDVYVGIRAAAGPQRVDPALGIVGDAAEFDREPPLVVAEQRVLGPGVGALWIDTVGAVVGH